MKISVSDESDPYAFLTNSDSSDSHSPEAKKQCGSPPKKGIGSSSSFPRLQLDESPGSVSGSNYTDNIKLQMHPRTPEGVSAESCTTNLQASSSVYSHQTENRPTGLELTKPLSGDMAQLTHIIRSVIQEEFATMKRDILNEVKYELEERSHQLHWDIITLQAEMLRQFQIHQVNELQQRPPICNLFQIHFLT